MITKNTTNFKFLIGFFLWTTLVGNANGQTFTSIFHEYDNFPNINEIAHGDFNGDGSLDFIITSGTNLGLSVKVGLGDGISSPVFQDLETELYLFSIEVVDFDQDGDLDFVGSAPNEDVSFLYKNDGLANFTREELPISDDYDAIRFVDLDNDGQIEMLVTFPERLVLYNLNQGVATFNQTLYEEGFFDTIYAITTVDFDQDGDLDVVANTSFEGVVLFTQTDALTFTQQLLFEDSSVDYELIAADFNQDGTFDFLRHDEFEQRTSVILSSAASGYNETILPNQFFSNGFSTAADFDMDGETEIIYADGMSIFNEISFFKYNTTTNEFDQSLLDAESSGIEDGGTVDLDGDGDLDLYVWGGRSFDRGIIFFLNDVNTSIHELANVKINVYPNPATSIINLEIDGELNYKVRILDLQGRTIKNTRNNARINIQSIPFGIYILEITDIESGQRVMERIVIED